MRIISFSNASAQPLLALPKQAMASWMTRLKHSVSGITLMTPAAQMLHNEQQASLSDATNTNDHRAASIATHTLLLPCCSSPKPASHNNLRVVREVDSTITPDCAGRMVISGRFADVCAELDRMVLRASSIH